tara:strand:- start:1767 stop:2162 length:396 start_codon:yes stop_codon:yes gene_type:complete
LLIYRILITQQYSTIELLKEKKMTYLYLAIAIIAEVVATSALKASEEFTRLVPSIIVIVGYVIAFYFMTLVLRVMPIGITYAIWSGIGIVLVAVIGFFLYKQTPDTAAIIGMGLIILGVVVINVFSKTISH